MVNRALKRRLVTRHRPAYRQGRRALGGRKTNAMNKLLLHFFILITFIQCRKESEDCHFL